jgi:hypothetical protein
MLGLKPQSLMVLRSSAAVLVYPCAHPHLAARMRFWPTILLSLFLVRALTGSHLTCHVCVNTCFASLSQIFEKIWENELYVVDGESPPPPFGDSQSDYETVVKAFYRYWTK